MGLVEYQRLTSLLASLDDVQWSAETECVGWDVRAMACHILGAAEFDSLSTLLRGAIRGRLALRRIGSSDLVDGINEVQIRDRAGLSTVQIVEQLVAAAPRAVSFRRNVPWVVRRLPIGVPMIGKVAASELFDSIFSRDVWMHRLDTCRATSTPMQLDDVHDGRLVALLVREWAGRHGRSFTLHLTGIAGGDFTGQGLGDCVELALDAVEFARVVSGRVKEEGLLATMVAF